MADQTRTRAEEWQAKLAVPTTEPVYNDDGVDLLQIREHLAMTPLERLRVVERFATMISKARVIRERL